MKENLQYVSAIAAGVAAVLWFAASVAWVSARERYGEDGWAEAQVVNDGTDVLRTLRRQGRLNALAALAALAACIAAGAQGAVFWF